MLESIVICAAAFIVVYVVTSQLRRQTQALERMSPQPKLPPKKRFMDSMPVARALLILIAIGAIAVCIIAALGY